MSGSANSHIGTLVERSSRFGQLVKLENKTTHCVLAALTAKVRELPEQLTQPQLNQIAAFLTSRSGKALGFRPPHAS